MPDTAATANPFDAAAARDQGTPTPAPPAGTPSTNPFDAVAATPQPKPTPPSTAPSAPNPFDAMFAHRAAQVGTTVGWALNAQHDFLLQKMFGGGSPDENLKRLREHLGIEKDYEDPKLFGAIPQPGWATSAERGVLDAVLGTETDPLTIETIGTGNLLSAGAKQAKLLMNNPLGRQLNVWLHWGGAVENEHGPEMVQKLRETSNVAGATGKMVATRMSAMAENVVARLKDPEKMQVAKALNGDIPDPFEAPTKFSPRERTAFIQLRRLTQLDYKMRFDVQIARDFRGMTGDLSDAQKAQLRAAIKAGVRPKDKVLGQRYSDLMREASQQVPKRESYMPGVHEGEETATGRPEIKVGPEGYDPRAKTREDIVVHDPQQLLDGFHAMSLNTGHQVRTKLVHDMLGDLIDDPKIKELMSKTIRATGDQRTDLQKLQDGWLAAIGYPRAATVAITPRHGVNIMDLALNTVPPQYQGRFMNNVRILTTKLINANPSKYASLTKEGRQLGALPGNFREDKALLQKFPDWVPGAGGKKVPGVAQLAAFNNKLVWAIDTAAKQEYAKILKSMGESTPGAKAAQRLVDYEHISPLVKALRYVAPFGTFRGQIPGQVLGGIARNPARAAFLQRASGGTMYGGQPEYGDHGATLYNPTADVGRGIDKPQDYLRSTLGAPIEASGSLAGEVMAGFKGQSLKDIVDELVRAPKQIQHGQWSEVGRAEKPSKYDVGGKYADVVKLRLARYLTYGNSVDLRYLADMAAAGIPEARTALDNMNLGSFQPRPGTWQEKASAEILQQALGVGVR